MEPLDIVDTAAEPASPDGKKLNAAVAITVALLATFMGICKVKDDNICQGMQQAQANRVDHWAFYQARNVREEVAKSTVVQLKLAAAGRPAAEQTAYQEAIQQYENLALEQAKKKAEAKNMAEQDQKDYDAANFKDDQFDLSDAMLAIAISLLAITALTQMRALYFAALVPTAFGVLMGLAGLAGWPIHPGALIALLS
jgi:ribosomal protein S13